MFPWGMRSGAVQVDGIAYGGCQALVGGRVVEAQEERDRAVGRGDFEGVELENQVAWLPMFGRSAEGILLDDCLALLINQVEEEAAGFAGRPFYPPIA